MTAALTRYHRHRYAHYHIAFKKLRAKFRYTIKKARRNSWISYLSSITWKTSISEVWKKVKKIAGKYVPTPPPIIKVNNTLTSETQDVSNLFVDHFAEVSSKSPNSLFYQYRLTEEQRNIDFTTRKAETYNLPFTMKELMSALSNSKDSAPGPDDIPYAMLRNIPKATLNFLLS